MFSQSEVASALQAGLRGGFPGGSFRKGMRVPIGVLGGVVWGRVQVRWWGVACLWEVRKKKGKGLGWR